MRLPYRIRVMRRRWWWNHTFRWPLWRTYYRARYGIDCGADGSMMPRFGKGEFVSVFRRGPFLDIVDERKDGREFIRLVPYQPNHGVMVERWVDGRLCWRTHMDFEQFVRVGFDSAEVSREAVAGRGVGDG